MLHRQDPARAIAIASSLPQATEAAKNHRREMLALLLVDRENDIDFEVAYRKLADFPQEDREFLEKSLLKAVVRSLLDYHQEDAAQQLAAMPPEDAAPLTLELFSNGAGTDPIRAAPHLAKLPEALQTTGLDTDFAEIWVAGNASMASQWVKELPEGKSRNAAIHGLAGGLAKNFSEEAMVWAASVTEEAGRLAAIQNVISCTTPEAQVTVTEALNRLDLSPEARASINFPPSP